MLEQLETQFYAQALKAFQASDFTTAGFNNPQLVVDQLTFIANDEATHTTVLEVCLITAFVYAVVLRFLHCFCSGSNPSSLLVPSRSRIAHSISRRCSRI